MHIYRTLFWKYCFAHSSVWNARSQVRKDLSMESVSSTLDGPNSLQTKLEHNNIELLPRPCSMPSFDRKIDISVKRGIQTLPLKRSAKRGLVSIITLLFWERKQASRLAKISLLTGRNRRSGIFDRFGC